MNWYQNEFIQIEKENNKKYILISDSINKGSYILVTDSNTTLNKSSNFLHGGLWSFFKWSLKNL